MEAEIAIVDYHFLLKEFEICKKYHLVIPHPHIKTLEGLLSADAKNISLYKVNQILCYLQENAEILALSHLPQLDVKTKGIKPKTCRFVRYVLAARDVYPNIKVLSNSRETKFLLKQLNIPVSTK